MLKELREKSGLTQAELAKALGYTTPQFVSNWERGLCEPPPEKYPKLAKLLNFEYKHKQINRHEARADRSEVTQSF